MNVLFIMFLLLLLLMYNVELSVSIVNVCYIMHNFLKISSGYKFKSTLIINGSIIGLYVCSTND